MLTQKSQNISKKVENLLQQHQFQTLLQNDQLDKNMKKILMVMFYIGNTNENLNTNKNIININNYLDKRNLTQIKDFTD